MKGIILASGTGTRLYPITISGSKHLLPVYDKPMIYYPLCTLMLAEIRDIMIISTEEDKHRFQRLLGDGSNFGIRLEYAVQQEPEGLTQSFQIGREFIGEDTCALILGDNIFYGNGMVKKLHEAVADADQYNRATVFAYYVTDPTRFGVVEFDKNRKVLSIEEKPEHPKSNYAVTGLYFYPRGVADMADRVERSRRNGEFEITTLNNMYLEQDRLEVEIFGRGYTWYDCGTMDSLMDAANYVRMIEQNQGIKLSVPEEVACRYGWIDEQKLRQMAEQCGNSNYGQHLLDYLNNAFL